MHIEDIRNAWLGQTLAALAEQTTKIYATITRKNRIEPDPGGMRDEMEREFFARASRPLR